MANAFKTSGWPMLLILAEANAFNTSGAYNEFPKWGRRPKAAGPFGEGRPPLLYAPLVLKALASASIKSIGHPLVLETRGNYLF